MPPFVYHYETGHSTKAEMKPGMAFTIEPILMLNENY